ncbi:beta-glucuronosyltransferase GlcAT14B-like [Impatiens glandulifera]|uniref:beta-glucuronosyltransferase GlcAT14B-like n=1 Tax=Impatiens glandulifera TaxID=253017 RepID=UPI001FB06CAF|nr:beta-glucuronosyltransferase GlcAT14B-like [Impatiens glandulifera]
MGSSVTVEKKWVFPLVITSLMCIFLVVTSFNMGLVSSMRTINSIISIFPSHISVLEEQDKLPPLPPPSPPPPPPPPAAPPLPRFAYLVSGSKGDLEKLWRTLRALYHPNNYYVVHLDLESTVDERIELESRVEKDPVFAKVGNVYMNSKANMVTYRGPTMVANTLHACAILLKRSKDWDWFINLSASDYPLVTQDDLIYTFSNLSRDLNFIEYTSDLGWKADYRGKPLIVDPGLYDTKKQDIFWVNPKRTLPTAFKLFTGSAWMILSRAFVEYLIWGWDNLPRTLLMYYTNFLSSPEGYFQTVICNAPEFAHTVVNHDMHFITWDNPPTQHPRVLSLNDTDWILSSGAAFARKFKQDTPILDKIDKELLKRRNGSFTPGAWCAGKPKCSRVVVGTSIEVKPGKGASKLRRLINRLILSPKFAQNQCR